MVDALHADFPGGAQDGLLPKHFLESPTFTGIGGCIIKAGRDDQRFWGLVLPTKGTASDPACVVRTYWLNAGPEFKDDLETQVGPFLNSHHFGRAYWYDPMEKTRSDFPGTTVAEIGGYTYAAPSKNQALTAQALQSKVWGVHDQAYLYPHDIYHPDSGLATRLVVTHNGTVVGFLFGFYGRGKQWMGKAGEEDPDVLWLESQLMGVDPEHRRMGIAKSLKLIQRRLAIEQGLDLVHWTVDPLQAGNAYLNFNTLGGLAATFYPDYYSFNNELNQVPASRIGLSWFVNSQRAIGCANGQPLKPDYAALSQDSGTEVIMTSPDHATIDGIRRWSPTGETILIEIPANWNAVQKNQLDNARQWRQITDAVFAKTLGIRDDQYALTGVVTREEDGQPFLVAQRSAAKFAV